MPNHTIPGLGQITLPSDLAVRIAILPTTQKNQRPGHILWGGAASYYSQHETGNTNSGANAEMHMRYLQSGAPDNYGNPQVLSYHLTVDDRQVIFLLPLNEVGWHAGDGGGTGNFDSIACELCVNRGIDTARSRKNAATVAAAIMEKLGIPLANFVPHQYWSGKWCPTQLLNERAFEAQRALVGSLMAADDTTPTVPVYPKGGSLPPETGQHTVLNGTNWWWFPTTWTVADERGCPRFTYANAKEKTGPDLPEGATFEGQWIVRGGKFEERDEWVVTAWGSRIPMKRLSPKVDISV